MTSAVIVAAGRGTRMGPGIDKLFLDVAGAPVIVHTWRRFDSIATLDELVLVVREGMQEAFAELAALHGFRKPFRFVPGGAERQDSVWNGLVALDPRSEVVAIQDGARPCTDAGLIERCLATARARGAAVAAHRAVDTIKETDGGRASRGISTAPGSGPCRPRNASGSTRSGGRWKPSARPACR